MANAIKQYTLMHKNIPVVELALDTVTGAAGLSV